MTHLGAGNDVTMEESEGPPLVLESGSSTMKAGFSGDDAPRCVFPTRIRYQLLRHPNASESWQCSKSLDALIKRKERGGVGWMPNRKQGSSIYVGDEAQSGGRRGENTSKTYRGDKVQ